MKSYLRFRQSPSPHTPRHRKHPKDRRDGPEAHRGLYDRPSSLARHVTCRRVQVGKARDDVVIRLPSASTCRPERSLAVRIAIEVQLSINCQHFPHCSVGSRRWPSRELVRLRVWDPCPSVRSPGHLIVDPITPKPQRQNRCQQSSRDPDRHRADTPHAHSAPGRHRSPKVIILGGIGCGKAL